MRNPILFQEIRLQPLPNFPRPKSCVRNLILSINSKHRLENNKDINPTKLQLGQKQDWLNALLEIC